MVVLHDPRNPKAVEINTFLHEKLQLDRLAPEMTVVIGGDGFMLESVRKHYSPDTLFLGINCGRLGFLMNDIPENQDELPGLILSDRLRIRTFPRISMAAIDTEGRMVRAEALNDVCLERSCSRGCHLKLKINGVVVVEHMVCDGLIFCTALGSTAYSFSAGASPCHPSLSILGVTPVCPHAPRLPPLYVPLDSSVEAEVLNRNLRPVSAIADGLEYCEVTRMTISNSGRPVKLAFFPGHHFTATLVGKLLIT